MIQDSRATRLRFIPAIFLCGLIVSSSSCVKLPRQYDATNIIGDGRNTLANREAVAGQLIDINTAPPEELEKLPGIGRGLAARIVQHRKQYGRFRRVEHLIMVRGIGDRRFRKMRFLITAG